MTKSKFFERLVAIYGEADKEGILERALAIYGEAEREALERAYTMVRVEAQRIAIIQKEVADHFNVTIDQLTGGSRSKKIAYPRQIAMYLCRKLTDISYSKIGQKFGKKDHSTTLSNVRKISKLVEHNHTRTIEGIIHLEERISVSMQQHSQK